MQAQVGMFVNPLGRNPTNYLPYVAFTLSIKGQCHEHVRKLELRDAEGGSKFLIRDASLKTFLLKTSSLYFLQWWLKTQKIVKFDARKPSASLGSSLRTFWLKLSLYLQWNCSVHDFSALQLQLNDYKTVNILYRPKSLPEGSNGVPVLVYLR